MIEQQVPVQQLLGMKIIEKAANHHLESERLAALIA